MINVVIYRMTNKLISTVKLANEKLSVPITCKIRVFTEVDKTVRYAQMLERAGCQVGLHSERLKN